MGEHRDPVRGHAHRPVHRDLPRRGRQQVVTAHHVGDLHEHVVDRDRERVQRRTVGPGQHEVGHVRVVEGDLAADQVGERGGALRHPEPDHRPAALCLVGGDLVGGERAAVAVVPARAAGLPRGLPPLLEFLRRAVAVIGVPAGQELGHPLGVDVQPLALLVGPERAAHTGPLVPVEPEPAQCVLRGGDVLRLHPGGVGVLDAQHEHPAGGPGERPVVQRGADVAHVQVTSG